jgi:tyrosinase
MQTSTSPADPLFWLHHAFIDKLLADWHIAHTGAAFNPPNTAETLQPPPILTRTVNQVLSTQALGYVYA